MKNNRIGEFNFDESFTSEFLTLESIASSQSYVDFGAKDGNLTVSFYGKEVQARKQFDIASKTKFSFSAIGAEMTTLFREFRNGRVMVYENQIKVKSGETVLTRQIRTDELPCEFPDFENSEFQPLPTDIFEMAAFVSFAAAKSFLGKASELTAIQLRENAVSIYACDGYRGVRVQGTTVYDGEEKEYLFRPELTESLAKLCKKNEDIELQISSTRTKYLLKVGDMEITFSILDAPSVGQMLDSAIDGLGSNPSMEVSMSAPDLTCYLQRTKLVEEHNILRQVLFSFDEEKQMVKVKYQAGIGELVETFDAKFGGTICKKFKIAFNPKLLLESCSRFVGETFTAQFLGNTSPVLVREQRGDYNVVYVVLPIRISDIVSSVSDSDEDDDTRESEVVSALPEGETSEPEFSEEDLV